MSDTKKELDEFEARLRTMKSVPAISMFLGLIEGMSEPARYDALEQQKKLMKISDALSQGLRHILSSENGERLFLEELKKRAGS